MSASQQAQEFVTRLETDEELQTQLEDANLVDVAEECGFELSPEEIVMAIKEHQSGVFSTPDTHDACCGKPSTSSNTKGFFC